MGRARPSRSLTAAASQLPFETSHYGAYGDTQAAQAKIQVTTDAGLLSASSAVGHGFTRPTGISLRVVGWRCARRLGDTE